MRSRKRLRAHTPLSQEVKYPLMRHSVHKRRCIGLRTSDKEPDPFARHLFTPKALCIVELLEAVLLHLDYKTLLLAQRVSRFWHDTINGSKGLRTKLFLEPATIDEAIRFNVLEDQSLVHLGQDGKLSAIFNVHVFDIVHFRERDDAGELIQLAVRPLACYTEGNQSGSWFEQSIAHGDEFYIDYKLYVEPWDASPQYLCADPVFHASACHHENMRILTWEAKNAVRAELGPKVDWTRSRIDVFRPGSTIIRYGRLKEIMRRLDHELALLYKSWYGDSKSANAERKNAESNTETDADAASTFADDAGNNAGLEDGEDDNGGNFQTGADNPRMHLGQQENDDDLEDEAGHHAQLEQSTVAAPIKMFLRSASRWFWGP